MASEQQRIASIEAARERRVTSAGMREAKTEWFIREVCDHVRMPLRSRVRLATELIKNRVIRNISRPVTKTVIGRKTIVTNRSKPGEFPKADTTQLMKTVFSAYEETGEGSYTGYVGTPIDYGVILELRMARSFLVRSLRESYNDVLRILTGPIR